MGSVEGSVIQATGRLEFQDGSRIGIQSEVKNSLQSACILPKVNLVGHPEESAMTKKGVVLAE